MRFLLDQSADGRLSRILERLGPDVTRIGTHYPDGLPDSEVLATALREGRILITNDRDFGHLVFVEERRHAGVIYLRLSTTRLDELTARLTDVLAQHQDDIDAFLVVTDQRVRVRRNARGRPDSRA